MPPSCFQSLPHSPLQYCRKCTRERILPPDVFTSVGSHGTVRDARQIGNAIRSHSKKGTLAATDKRGHSPATPGEEGGRNHKHPFPFLHWEGEVGGWADTMAPTLSQWSQCCLQCRYSRSKLTMHWTDLDPDSSGTCGLNSEPHEKQG